MHKLLFIHKMLRLSTCFAPQMLIFRRSHCIHAAYGAVALYERSWWPVGTQTSEHSICVSTGHHDRS